MYEVFLKEKKLIYIYTDGACSNNQSEKNFGGWGSILMFNNFEKELSGYEVDTTNNRMEMTAVIEGLKTLKRHDIPIKIFSDSAYIVNCINQKWYINWEKNGWKNSKKEVVLNKDLWEEILLYYRKCKSIDFVKVKGHVNPENRAELKKSFQKYRKDIDEKMSLEDYKKHIEYNNRVDKLAVEASMKAKLL